MSLSANIKAVQQKAGVYAATGKRKNAIARVRLTKGTGKVTINGRVMDDYFGRPVLQMITNQPFFAIDQMGKFDIVARCNGGGLSGQAGAVRHGISRALENYDPQMRPALKAAGMITRDARVVERKKIGLHKARRSKQWAKR